MKDMTRPLTLSCRAFVAGVFEPMGWCKWPG